MNMIYFEFAFQNYINNSYFNNLIFISVTSLCVPTLSEVKLFCLFDKFFIYQVKAAEEELPVSVLTYLVVKIKYCNKALQLFLCHIGRRDINLIKKVQTFSSINRRCM